MLLLTDQVHSMPVHELEELHIKGHVVQVETDGGKLQSIKVYLAAQETEDPEELPDLYDHMQDQYEQVLTEAQKTLGEPTCAQATEHPTLPELPFFMDSALWNLPNANLVLGWEHQDQDVPVLLWVGWFRSP